MWLLARCTLDRVGAKGAMTKNENKKLFKFFVDLFASSGSA